MSIAISGEGERVGAEKVRSKHEKKPVREKQPSTERDWVSESNLRVKQSMARELLEMGLSREAVERLLKVGKG